MSAAYFQVLPTCTVTKSKVATVTIGTGYNRVQLWMQGKLTSFPIFVICLVF